MDCLTKLFQLQTNVFVVNDPYLVLYTTVSTWHLQTEENHEYPLVWWPGFKPGTFRAKICVVMATRRLVLWWRCLAAVYVELKAGSFIKICVVFFTFPLQTKASSCLRRFVMLHRTRVYASVSFRSRPVIQKNGLRRTGFCIRREWRRNLNTSKKCVTSNRCTECSRRLLTFHRGHHARLSISNGANLRWHTDCSEYRSICFNLT